MLKIGVVGLGWFGRKHLEMWQSMPDVEVVAVADNRGDLLDIGSKKAQSSFHTNDRDSIDLTNIQIFTNVDDLLDNCVIDLMDIVVSTRSHFLVAKTALEKGISVLIEKPVTTSYDEVCILADLALRKKAQIFTGHLLRFDKRNRYIKDLITSEQTGDLRYLSFKRNFQPQAHLVYGDVHPLYSALIHDIDLALWFTNKKVTSATGMQKYLLARDMPDVLSITAEFDNDLLCTFENNWHVASSCPYGFQSEIGIYGSKATILESNVPIVQFWGSEKVEMPEFFFWSWDSQGPSGALYDMLVHFKDCVIYDKESEILPLSAIVEVMRTIMLIKDALK